LVEKPEEKRTLERRTQRLKNIKTNFQEIGWDGLNWIYMAQDRDRCREFLDYLREWLSRNILLHGVSYDVYVPTYT
jgi:hypothetical protein